jgi:hypothetical protein
MKWTATTWISAVHSVDPLTDSLGPLGMVLDVRADLVIPEQEILIEGIEQWLQEDWK